jgi:hypothetical protein
VINWANKSGKNLERISRYPLSTQKRVMLIKSFLQSLIKKFAVSKLKCELLRFLKLEISLLHVTVKKVHVV